MLMQTIDILGNAVVLNIVNHDSGEEPASACTNTLIGAKVGNVTYQYLNVDTEQAVRGIAASIGTAANSSVPLPLMLTVVVSRFDQQTSIDWQSVESTLMAPPIVEEGGYKGKKGG